MSRFSKRGVVDFGDNFYSHSHRSSRHSNDSGNFSDLGKQQQQQQQHLRQASGLEETDSLNEFNHRQSDYYNGKLVQLENSVRFLRAENARLASRQQHHQFEEQPDASISELERLKRRSAALESAATRLESKVRHERTGDNQPTLSDLRRDYERRRTRDLVENGRQLEEKERELERLRRHYDGLQYMTRNNAAEKDALERMLQTAQRERLTLQHQLSWNQEFFSDASTEDRLKRLTGDIERVEAARRELDEEVRRLRESAVRVKYLGGAGNLQPRQSGPDSESAETEEAAASAKSTAEAIRLRRAFKGAGRDADRLQFHMAELELIMKHMRDSLERKFQLEQEGTQLRRLIDRRSRDLLGSKPTDQKPPRQNENDVEGLRSQLRELEKRSELQSLRHEELLLELEAAKKRQRHEEIRQLTGTTATAVAAAALGARGPAVMDGADGGSDYRIPWTEGDATDEPLIDDGDFFALRQAPVGGSESEGWHPSRQSPADAAPPDGYMFGELIDGKSGYIPSNFVQQLTSDKPETQRSAAVATVAAESNPLAPGEWCVTVAASPTVRYETDLLRVLAGFADSEEGPQLSSVSPPRELRVERQMASSVLLCWRQPAHDPTMAATGDSLSGYEVLLDGKARCHLAGGEKTRALLEAVLASERHRVSVCAVTATGRKSDEAACTVSVGGGPEAGSWLAPTSLHISNLTGTSAVLAFLPASSAMPHSVLLNGTEFRRCEAGGRCRVRFSGLSPDTLYRAEVRALPAKRDLAALASAEAPPILTAAVEFRTGLGVGRPEPPSNVQVEPGPQHDSLLVTWTPLPSTESNGTRLGGYAVYADSKHLLATCMLAEASGGPTAADHCLVSMANLPADTRVVTCRTIATNQEGLVVESEDSSPACELSSVLGAAATSGWHRNRPGQLPLGAEANEFGILVSASGVPILSAPSTDGKFFDASGNPLACRRVEISIDHSTGEQRLIDKLDGLPIRGLRLGPNGVLLDEAGLPVRGEQGEFFGANHQHVYGRRGADGELLDDEGHALQRTGVNSFGVLADLTTGLPITRLSDGALLDAHGQAIDCRRCEPSANGADGDGESRPLINPVDGFPIGVTSVNVFGVLVDSQGRPLRGPLGEFYGPNRAPVYGGLRGPDGQLIDPATGGQRRTRANEFGALSDADTGELLLGPEGQLLNSRAQLMPSRRVRFVEPTEEGGQSQLVDADTGEPLVPETDWRVNEHGVLVDAQTGLALRGPSGEFFGPPDGLPLAGGPTRDAEGRLVRDSDSFEQGRPLKTRANDWGILVEVVGEGETAEEKPILSKDGRLLDASGRVINCRTVPPTAAARARLVEEVAKGNVFALNEHGVVVDTDSSRPVRGQAAGEFLGADGRPVYGPRDADGRLTVEAKLNEFGILVDAATGAAILGPRGQLLDANGQAIACQVVEPDSEGGLPVPQPGQEHRLNAHGVLIDAASGLPVRDSSGRFYGQNRRPVYGERMASGKLVGAVRVDDNGHLVDAEGNPIKGPGGEMLDAKGQPIDEAAVAAASAAAAATASASSADAGVGESGAEVADSGTEAAAAAAAAAMTSAETATDAVESAEAAAAAGGEEFEAATIATETTETGAQADFEDEPPPGDPGFFGRIKKGFQEFQEKVEEFADETNEKMKELNEETKRKMEAFNEDARKKFEDFGEGTKKTFENLGDSTAAAFKKLDPKNLGDAAADVAPEEAAAAAPVDEAGPQA